MDERELRLGELAELFALSIFYERERELGTWPLDFVLGVEPEWEGPRLLVGTITDFVTERLQYTGRPGTRHDSLPLDVARVMVDVAREQRIFLAEARETAVQAAEYALRYESWTWQTGMRDEWREAAIAVNPCAGAAEEFERLIRKYWTPTLVPNYGVFATVRTWGQGYGLI
jgi:hypothetical protein